VFWFSLKWLVVRQHFSSCKVVCLYAAVFFQLSSFQLLPLFFIIVIVVVVVAAAAYVSQWGI
jgi:hypothetical protein